MKSLLKNQTASRMTPHSDRTVSNEDSINYICKSKKKIKNALYVSNGKVKSVTLYYCPKEKKITETSKPRIVSFP